jgi:cell division protein FtsW
LENRAEKQNEQVMPAMHRFDFLLFGVILAVCAFGLVMLYSASYYYGITHYGEGAYFLKRQLIFFAAGFVFMIGLSFLKYTFYRKIALIAYIGIIGLLIWTLISGVVINKARRWINVFGFQFQPSEFAKFVIVIVLATIMCAKWKWLNMQSFFKGVVPCLVPLIPLAFLIIKQPNLSMILILAFTTYVMLYLGGVKITHRFVLVLLGVGAVIAYIIIKGSYHSNRIYSYFHPTADPTGANYQSLQSRIALGSGGFFGKGLDLSRQKFNFLPERENDYILAIIGEELGFVGCFLLLAAYFFAVIRGTAIALRCRDRFGRLLAGGITAVLAIQVIMNVGVVTSAIPATGQTLPFVSYGGTSLLAYMMAMGILLNISRYTEVKEKNVRRTE